METTTLNIAHFNDVYQVSEHKVNGERIDVSKFATLLEGVTSKWSDRGDGRKDGLTVFSGDLFSPSIESSITRGKHMLPIINELNVDIAVAGNHEFDFGIRNCKSYSPSLLSNIVDTTTGKTPEPLQEFHVLERSGVRIGLIGLVEQDWIPTIVGWPEHFQYQDMVQVANALSAKLRDPAGEHQCDIIFALTHSRISNDIAFAKSVLALSPAAQASKNIASEHGVDILLGGHDHIYWISKGVTGWEGYDLNTPVEDAKDDQGDVLVVKSGTDFQDLSEITLMLKDTPSGSVRRKVITEIRGKRLSTKGTTPVHAAIKAIYDDEVKYIEESLKEPIGTIEEELDARMSLIRTQESPVANWVSDCIREAYDEALINKGYTGADATFINAGGIRGDRVYAPGTLLLGDLKTMFPYNDSIVVIQVDGKTLWDAAESGLSSWPEWEGRFPAISGFRIEWDSRKEPGNRVLGVWMVEDPDEIGPNGIPFVVDKEPVSRTSDKKYLIVTGEYLANGGDGYTMFKGQPVIITAENGQPANQLVKKYIGGSQFLKRDEQAAESTQVEGGRRAHKARRNVDSTHARKLAPAAYSAVVHNRLGLLDPYQRSRARGHASCCDKGPDCPKCRQYGLVDRRAGARSLLSKESRIAAVSAADEEAQQSLPVIRPFIDGRVKDVSKA